MQEMYWGLILVVRPVEEGKIQDWADLEKSCNAVRIKGLSQYLESSESWMALRSVLNWSKMLCLNAPTLTGHWMDIITLVRHDILSAGEMSFSPGCAGSGQHTQHPNKDELTSW